MNYCKVVAIMNISDFSLLQEALSRYTLPGITVSKAQGFGDYVNEFDRFGFSDNLRLEIYTQPEQAEALAQTLAQLANELTDGGGVVAIEPVSVLLNVRQLEPNRSA